MNAATPRSLLDQRPDDVVLQVAGAAAAVDLDEALVGGVEAQRLPHRAGAALEGRLLADGPRRRPEEELRVEVLAVLVRDADDVDDRRRVPRERDERRGVARRDRAGR